MRKNAVYGKDKIKNYLILSTKYKAKFNPAKRVLCCSKARMAIEIKIFCYIKVIILSSISFLVHLSLQNLFVRFNYFSNDSKLRKLTHFRICNLDFAFFFLLKNKINSILKNIRLFSPLKKKKRKIYSKDKSKKSSTNKY